MDPHHLLVKIVKILNSLKIPYLVTGGVAIYVWGRPRFTADIDLVVELQEKDVKKLVQTLIKEGYVDEDAVREAITNQGEFNFIDQEEGIKVDFWILKKDEFDKSKFKRRIAKKVLNQNIYFISPEDLILVKLLWFKESRSFRHLEDILSILQMLGKKVNFGYLREWAKKQNTLGVLEEQIALVSR
ncbi:nucleotidyl transferase AbiEii/AbiGii toxin family protein [Candidatus Daviesbacteria bacterium]|nr:nucleotidyl transferase AbiEii/AbiGii toxin family protein [Candidatus Daviesbacteria bacterium]